MQIREKLTYNGYRLRTVYVLTKLYNSKRLHMSIGNKTSNIAHAQTGEQKKMWKNKNYRRNEHSF